MSALSYETPPRYSSEEAKAAVYLVLGLFIAGFVIGAGVKSAPKL